MKMVKTRSKVILFTCNWQPYHSLDLAGRLGLAYSTDMVLIRLSCLGRVSPGLILKAYQLGAAGVCLLGCPEGECHYQTGNQQAEGVVEETRELLALLGYSPDTLQYRLIPAGDGEKCVKILTELVAIIAEKNDRQ